MRACSPALDCASHPGVWAHPTPFCCPLSNPIDLKIRRGDIPRLAVSLPKVRSAAVSRAVQAVMGTCSLRPPHSPSPAAAAALACQVPGGDVAGVVAEADPGSAFQPGQRVFALSNGYSPNVNRGGTYAEFASLPEPWLARIPEGAPAPLRVSHSGGSWRGGSRGGGRGTAGTAARSCGRDLPASLCPAPCLHCRHER